MENKQDYSYLLIPHSFEDEIEEMRIRLIVHMIEDLPNVKPDRIKEVVNANCDNIFNWYKQKVNYNDQENNS